KRACLAPMKHVLVGGLESRGFPMRFVFAVFGLLASIGTVASGGCSKDGVSGDDGVDGAADARPSGPDAHVDNPSDMTGIWIAEQHTTSTALSADQKTTNWYYYKIAQTGDTFMVTDQLNCGFVVDGTTTVTINDATLEALATEEFAGPGRKGSYKASADGKSCDFTFDRMYDVRGATKATFLTDTWKVGDPPKALSEFMTLPKAPPGMEDWDHDASAGPPAIGDGITLHPALAGVGDRYVSQRDWT